MRQNFRFQRFFVWHFVHHWGVFLGFTAQRHKLLSIYRCTKSQAGFNMYAVKHIGFICMARLTRLARITRLTGFTGFARSTRNPRLTSPRQPHLFAKNDDALLPTLPGTCQPLCCCLRGVFFCSACSIMFSCPLHTQAPPPLKHKPPQPVQLRSEARARPRRRRRRSARLRRHRRSEGR